MAKRTAAREDAAPILVWLRHDLRLDDNPALAHAASTGRPVVPLFVLEDEGPRAPGAASRWYLHHALEALAEDLAGLGSGLVLRRGRAETVVPALAREIGAQAVHANRRYGDGAGVDARVGGALACPMEVFEANLQHDPDRVRTKTGGPYRVFTPFRKAVEAIGEPRPPIDAPMRLPAPPAGLPAGDRLADWALRPTAPDWTAGLRETWTAGERAAQQRFAQFCDEILPDYAAGRERPASDETSRMSPHLHFGEVSPLRLRLEAQEAGAANGIAESELSRFRFELMWRDFNHHLLHHFPHLPEANFDARFDRLAWRTAPEELAAWQHGRTGYPIVDAGMRQLWQIGWMHNRVRLIVGSFLTRHLLIHWREGEAWFWDTLVDADLANNASQWQWIAGTGADPQPFFRIFNPVTQSERFDAQGDYIRRYVPELADMPATAIHAPWAAEPAVLAKAGVTLGRSYPKPIVDHAFGRQRALSAYAALRG